MEKSTKENGKQVENMVMGSGVFLTETVTRANGQTVDKKEMVSENTKIISKKVSFSIVSNTAKASNISKTVITTKVAIKKASQMVSEDTHGKMVVTTRAILYKVTVKAKASCTKRTAVSTKVINLVC